MVELSICIPVYDYNCIATVMDLCKQIEQLSIQAEVLLIDDASTIELNVLANFKHPFYSYEKLNKNVGRAKIRNLLAKKANYHHLLFLDGDSGIPNNFILKYINTIKKHPNNIIYGGRIHPKTEYKPKKLRYNYGVQFEDKIALARRRKPYHRFMTNNFIVTKNTLKKILFNEELLKYGHEDTFFAYELKKNAVPIIHVDNPVIHLDLDTNRDFIEKTKDGIKNLILLKSKHPEFMEYSKLLKLINNSTFLRFKITRLIANNLSKLFETISNKTSNTNSFQLFKLFYTISLYK
ncbi:glycosyltransferase family 2 protein [Lacinutrix sp. Hel_I_90]|uniref:glycosyltransferase family 2 protein n=1 Tax=Lacinutrix sp. Hel_I_90 TaxID=1249999 RepID=UPI0009E34E37|nr:glycosyltransferase family 2 protein [Lacinutrix sp. Hel_I_90]